MGYSKLVTCTARLPKTASNYGNTTNFPFNIYGFLLSVRRELRVIRGYFNVKDISWGVAKVSSVGLDGS